MMINLMINKFKFGRLLSSTNFNNHRLLHLLEVRRRGHR